MNNLGCWVYFEAFPEIWPLFTDFEYFMDLFRYIFWVALQIHASYGIQGALGNPYVIEISTWILHVLYPMGRK